MKRTRVLFFLFLLFVYAIGPLIAGGTEEEKPRSGRNEFVVNVGNSVAELDPHLASTREEYHVAGALFEGLFRFDGETGKGKPGLALDWTTNEDRTVYTFKLRHARWSDGEPITADTVARSWLRVLSPELNSPHIWLLRSLIKESGIRVIDDRRLQVELKKPVPYPEDILWHPAFAVVPVHLIERYGKAWTDLDTIVCGGPYLLEHIDPDDRMVCRVNKEYWNYKSVGIERMVFLFEADPDKAYQLFIQGKVDWNRVIASKPASAVREMEAFHETLFCGTGSILCNLAASPLKNRGERRALADGLSTENLLTQSGLSGLRHASNLVPPGLYRQGGEEDSDGEAKTAIERGVLKEPMTLLLFEDTLWSSLAPRIAKQWKQNTGAEISVEEVGWDLYAERLMEGRFDLAVYSEMGEVLDPVVFLTSFESDSALNFSGFSHPRYDQLLRDAGRERPGYKRNELLSRAEALLLEEAAVIPLFHYTVFNMIDLEKWGGWKENLLDIHPLDAVFLPGDSGRGR